MNSDQSPSGARCSAGWHKLLSPSRGKRPHSSTMASATMTQNSQSFKFALWSLAVGIRKWNRQGARSMRQALHSFTVSSCSQGCCPTTTLLVLNADTLQLMGEAAAVRATTGIQLLPVHPELFRAKNKDKRGAKVRGF